MTSLLQCHLDRQGASDLVVDLIIKNHSSRIFLETIELGIALLEGGNGVIQVRQRFHPGETLKHSHVPNTSSPRHARRCLLLQKSFYQRLLDDKKAEIFFKVFYDRMTDAQTEIKTTVSVNTVEQLALKSDDADDATADQQQQHKKKGQQ